MFYFTLLETILLKCKLHLGIVVGVQVKFVFVFFIYFFIFNQILFFINLFKLINELMIVITTMFIIFLKLFKYRIRIFTKKSRKKDIIYSTYYMIKVEVPTYRNGSQYLLDKLLFIFILTKYCSMTYEMYLVVLIINIDFNKICTYNFETFFHLK